MIRKKCTKCKQYRELDEFYNNSQQSSGKHPSCKKCVRAQLASKYANDSDYRERAKKRARRWKLKNPLRKKERDKILYWKDPDKYRVMSREWYKTNRERAVASRKKYYKKHRRRLLALNKEWRDANPERKKAADRAWLKKNMARVLVKVKSWKQANPRKVKEYGRQYCQRHPEALKAAKANRRAREARIGGTLSAADVKKIILLWGGHCWICGRPYGAIDHVIPLARGGSNCPSNLRPICKSCNSSKGAKIVNEKWLEARRTKLGVTCIPTRIEPVEVPLSL